jgi:hypothetical protein
MNHPNVVVFFPGAENERIQPNFNAGEFKCKGDNWYWLVHLGLVVWLQQMREKIDRPLRVNSAFRTQNYNADIGGASRSKHMLGLAADLAVPDKMSSIALAGLAYSVGFRRIGVANGFVHVDTAPGEAYWAYTGDLKEGLQDKIERAAKQWQ